VRRTASSLCPAPGPQRVLVASNLVYCPGMGLSDAAGPALLIGLCISWGRPGRLVAGAMFALTGAAVLAMTSRSGVSGRS
jgi:hypothetical protein